MLPLPAPVLPPMLVLVPAPAPVRCPSYAAMQRAKSGRRQKSTCPRLQKLHTCYRATVCLLPRSRLLAFAGHIQGHWPGRNSRDSGCQRRILRMSQHLRHLIGGTSELAELWSDQADLYAGQTGLWGNTLS